MGGLDTIVNNAGISQSTPLPNYTADEWQRRSWTSTSPPSSTAAAPSAQIMTGRAGRRHHHHQLHGLQSTASPPLRLPHFQVRGQRPYTVPVPRARAKGIRVNAVAPGITKTDMVAALPKMIAPLIATIPLGRIGEPEDVANAFVYLASEMSSYVTGAVIPVDGAARS